MPKFIQLLKVFSGLAIFNFNNNGKFCFMQLWREKFENKNN